MAKLSINQQLAAHETITKEALEKNIEDRYKEIEESCEAFKSGTIDKESLRYRCGWAFNGGFTDFLKENNLKLITPSIISRWERFEDDYFQWKNANNWKENNAKTYVVYKTKSGSTDYKQLTNHITAGASGSALRAKQTELLGDSITDTYYADLADDTTSFYFATDANKSGFDTSTKETTLKWYRTNTITNVQAERGYYLTGYADDTTFHAQMNSFEIPGGISVMKYFDKAEINQCIKSVESGKANHRTNNIE